VIERNPSDMSQIKPIRRMGAVMNSKVSILKSITLTAALIAGVSAMALLTTAA
jgi:hypothetical protein